MAVTSHHHVRHIDIYRIRKYEGVTKKTFKKFTMAKNRQFTIINASMLLTSCAVSIY